MELNGTIQSKGSLYGSFDFDQADYNLVKNKPSINGVELVGNKTSEDLHIETGGGGGGGTTNYNDLENKPKINGVILQDELTLHSLGIQSEIDFPQDPTKYLNGEGEFTTPPFYVPINYDTAEQNTGIKWIDGKALYQRTFDIRNLQLTDNTWNYNILGTANSGINIKKYDGYFMLAGQDYIFPYSYYRGSSEYFTSVATVDTINVRPNMNAGVNINAGIITILYTKEE